MGPILWPLPVSCLLLCSGPFAIVLPICSGVFSRASPGAPPGEIAWMFDERAQRHHAALCPDGAGFRVERMLPNEHNAMETSYGFFPYELFMRLASPNWCEQ